MSQIRQNKCTGEWIIYAENRQKRPYDFVRSVAPRQKGSNYCPFCPGNENLTTETLFQYGEGDDWLIRVFPNLYPAVGETAEDSAKNDFYTCVPGYGRHEILVDTSEHNETIDKFSQNHMSIVLTGLHQRFCDMKKEKNVTHIQIFKNCGAEAGMSLSHSHWQIIGLSIMSKRMLDIEQNALLFQKESGQCIFCEMLTYELNQEVRVILQNSFFMAFVPYASRFPYEVWIAPKRHIASFADLNTEHWAELSELLLTICKKVVRLKEHIGYNICFVEGQLHGNKDISHWHIEILPRIGGFAGLECALETYINPVLPETAAEFYRQS